MLSMSEIIRWCHDNGIPTGPGRGSVGGSRVAYITDIIDTDPEKWSTVFSRFANEDREEIGDIDTDVIDTDRPKIFKYLIDRFGTDLTARVASYGTIQDKKVVDEVGRALAFRWKKQHPNEEADNPYSLAKLAKIKAEYDQDPEKAKKAHQDIFYYFDGLLDTKISQSVHPAGMVLSPISLSENYGTFLKDGEWCLLLDMDEVHDGCGLAKYDFLILKTVKLIKDACEYAGIPYPKSHEIDWEDAAVWEDMRRDQTGIFQFTESYAADCFKKFGTNSIEDMSLVTASIRPSGASYRDALLARMIHHNPSKLIDDLLKNNNGYLVYQEDIIAFLKEVCGLSGSYADTVRRGIARKKTELLEKAMPDILNGYCNKSDKPREVAETECKEFLQIIEDASSYMFGYNHSIEYCLVGYLCGYLRYYHPIEFITSYLNNAAKDKETIDGAKLAKSYGIKLTNPRYGISRSDYAFSREKNTIAKGLSSIKFIGDKVADELYRFSKENIFGSFTELLRGLQQHTSLDAKQLSILIGIDFFADFGNQRELTRIREAFDSIHGRKTLKRDFVESSPFEKIIKLHANDKRKDGSDASSYTITDEVAILNEIEGAIREVHLKDFGTNYKVKLFADVMGYVGYTTNLDEDRPKLYVRDVEPVKRKKDGKKFGYAVLTQSIGSGKESRMTVFNAVYEKDPIKKGDIIYCTNFRTDPGGYFTLTSYYHLGDDE